MHEIKRQIMRLHTESSAACDNGLYSPMQRLNKRLCMTPARMTLATIERHKAMPFTTQGLFHSIMPGLRASMLSPKTQQTQG
jgi:hypothetical protein